MTYQQWTKKWLALYVKPTTKTRTCEKYMRQCELHILPVLGKHPLDKLSALILQRFTVDLFQKGLSANTVNGIVSLLKSSLKCATKIGVSEKDFSSAIARPKGQERQVDCFTKTEQRKIERYVAERNDPRLFGIILTLYMGLRIGELLALTWDDVDVKKGALFVRKTCCD